MALARRWFSRLGATALAVFFSVVPLALAPSGAGASTYPPIPRGQIKLGALLTLSGPEAAIGLAQESAYKVMVSRINASGGIDGHAIDLDIVNDQGNPATAVSGAEKLVNDHVAGVVYAGTAATNQQTIPIFMKNKVPVVMLEPEDQWSNGTKYPYFFDNYPLNAPTMKYMVSFAKNNLHIKKLGILTDGDSFAQSILPDLLSSARQQHLPTAVVTFSPTAVDDTPEVQSVKSKGADGVALIAETGLGSIYSAMHTIGWSPPIVTTAVAYFIGYSSLGSLAKTTFSNCAVALKPGQQPDAGSVSLLKAVTAQTGPTPNDTSMVIYNDDFLIFKAAITKYHSTDPTAIAKAIEGMKNVSFTSPDYHYTFTATNHNGWPYSNIHMCKMSPLGPYDYPIISNGT